MFRFRLSSGPGGQGASPQVQLGAQQVIATARASIGRGDVTAAIDLLRGEVDSPSNDNTPSWALLTLLLARALASQGQLAEAVERLLPSLSQVQDRVCAAHILCARATELANPQQLKSALELALQARHLAGENPQIAANVRDLVAVIVPPLLLGREASSDLPEGLAQEAAATLIARLCNEPTNLGVAHTVALVAERLAADYESAHVMQATTTSDTNGVRMAEGRPGWVDEMWRWAARSWVLLAYSDTWQMQWRHRPVEIRGTSAGVQESIGTSLSDAVIARLEEIPNDLMHFWREHGDSREVRTAVERYLQQLVFIHIERHSATALATVLRNAPDVMAPQSVLQPIAGVSFLAHLDRLTAVRAWLHTESRELAVRAQHDEVIARALEDLQQCLSPIAPAYALRRLYRTDDAIAYCRDFAPHNQEAANLLAAILVEQSRAYLDAGDVNSSRSRCLEALHTFPHNSLAVPLLREICAVRVRAALRSSPPNYDVAIRAAREDLQVMPESAELKAELSHALRAQADHVGGLIDHDQPHTASVRLALSLLAESWELDPNPLDEGRMFDNLSYLIGRLITSPATKPQVFDECEVMIDRFEFQRAQHPKLRRSRVAVLRARVAWAMDNARAQRPDEGQIAELASHLERAWHLDMEHHDDDRAWSSHVLAVLASYYLPDEGWPVNLAPYDAMQQLIDRGLRLFPDDDILVANQAEILCMRAVAMIHLAGGFAAQPVPEHTRREVLRLFTESWQLSETEQRANLLAAACKAIEEYDWAEYYTRAALTLNPVNEEAQTTLAWLRIRPLYEAASSDAAQAMTFLREDRYWNARQYFERAERSLRGLMGDASWPAVAGLYDSVRHNLELLRESGNA